MVLLSFSVKEAELRAGTKIRTTRLYTPEKWKQWQATIPPNNTKLLDLWWKSRTPDGYLIDERSGADLYRLIFIFHINRLWPYRVDDGRSDRWATALSPMTQEEAQQYAREEGFEGQLDELLQFFEAHYAPLGNKIFQSIAFPPKVV